jgi:hypothetical protein
VPGRPVNFVALLQMRTVLGMLGLLFIVLLLGLLFKVKEGFGYSMGTMIQLQTSHVPGSVEEMEEEERAYLRQVQHDLINMTGSGL